MHYKDYLKSYRKSAISHVLSNFFEILDKIVEFNLLRAIQRDERDCADICLLTLAALNTCGSVTPGAGLKLPLSDVSPTPACLTLLTQGQHKLLPEKGETENQQHYHRP